MVELRTGTAKLQSFLMKVYQPISCRKMAFGSKDLPAALF